MPVEILQRAARRVTHSASTCLHLRPDKGQPDIAHHSHSGTQPSGRAARMVLEEVLYVLLYRSGKFFDCKRGHNLGNVCGLRFGLVSHRRNVSDAKTSHCAVFVDVARLIPAPDHGYRSRQAAAHVECEEFFHALDLASACLFCELQGGFENLPNTGRAYRMTVANEAATRIYRNLKRRFGFFWTHLRQRCGTTFHKVNSFARLGEPENFVCDNFSNGKAIMYLGSLQIARRQV